MADSTPSAGPWTAITLAIGLAAFVYLTSLVINAYETAAEAVSVLGIVIGPLAGIAAAAFGIKLSADAKSETKAVKASVAQIAGDLATIKIEDSADPVATANVTAERLRGIQDRLLTLGR